MIKAKKNVGIFQHLSKCLPHLDYCDIIIKPGSSLSVFEEPYGRLQYQALAITGTWHGSNRTKLYEELGRESLSNRHTSRSILQIHKIIERKAPGHLFKTINLSENHSHSTFGIPDLVHWIWNTRLGLSRKILDRFWWNPLQNM